MVKYYIKDNNLYQVIIYTKETNFTFPNGFIPRGFCYNRSNGLTYLKTLFGENLLEEGDYIVRNKFGDLMSYSPKNFNEQFDEFKNSPR